MGALLQNYASVEGERFCRAQKDRRRSKTKRHNVPALHMHRLHVHGMYSNATSTPRQRATSLCNMCQYAERCGDRGPVTIPGEELGLRVRTSKPEGYLQESRSDHLPVSRSLDWREDSYPRLRLSHQGTQTNVCPVCVGVQRRE